MTSYAPVGQLTGFFSKQLSLTDRLPWLYTVVSLANRLIYVGETHQEGGLLTEISAQLAGSNSTLQTKSIELGITRPGAPHLIVAARLPSNRDPAGFDGASGTIRMQCAATLQVRVVQDFISAKSWLDGHLYDDWGASNIWLQYRNRVRFNFHTCLRRHPRDVGSIPGHPTTHAAARSPTR